MRICELTDLEKVALTRSYVSYGVRVTMDRYECTQQQIKVVASQVRNEYVKEWCRKHKALPVDLSMVLCIERWLPIDAKLRSEYFRFFSGFKKDYKKLMKTTDFSLYKLPRTVPKEFKEALVRGVEKSNHRSDIIRAIPIDHSILRKWQEEVWEKENGTK